MNITQATIIDLTHTVSPEIPTWDGTCGFEQETILDYADCTSEVKFRVQRFSSVAGIGTHMDAPAHCIPDAKTIDRLKLTSLCAPCITLDVRNRAHAEYSVSIQDIKFFEQAYGTIPAGALVAFNTGWDRFWHDPRAYHNDHRFPSIAPEVATLLIERNIAGVAIDTLGVDRPIDGFPVHQILLSAGIYIVENATNLDKLPPVGAYTFALLIKIAQGTEAPIRFVAFKPAC